MRTNPRLLNTFNQPQRFTSGQDDFDQPWGGGCHRVPWSACSGSPPLQDRCLVTGQNLRGNGPRGKWAFQAFYRLFTTVPWPLPRQIFGPGSTVDPSALESLGGAWVKHPPRVGFTMPENSACFRPSGAITAATRPKCPQSQ